MPAEYTSDSKNRMLFSDLAAAFFIILIFSIFKSHADLVLLISWPFIFGYFLLKGRIKALTHLILATLMAVIWVQFAKEYYGYKYDYLKIFGMNTLPLMAWTLTLLGWGEMCNYLRFKSKIRKFLFFVPTFWFLLILFETVAYHVLEIRNTMTGNYVGLPFCNCLHAPTWMKFVYFSMGPLFYGLSQLADRYIDKLYPNKSGK
ncbi:MAG: hypothetical protein WCI31_03065 [Prolixibacteraceae bacterium]